MIFFILLNNNVLNDDDDWNPSALVIHWNYPRLIFGHFSPRWEQYSP